MQGTSSTTLRYPLKSDFVDEENLGIEKHGNLKMMMKVGIYKYIHAFMDVATIKDVIRVIPLLRIILCFGLIVCYLMILCY
jgi:hypothetical protein